MRLDGSGILPDGNPPANPLRVSFPGLDTAARLGISNVRLFYPPLPSLTGEVLCNNGITYYSHLQVQGNIASGFFCLCFMPGCAAKWYQYAPKSGGYAHIGTISLGVGDCYLMGSRSSCKRASYSPRMALALDRTSYCLAMVSSLPSNSRCSDFFATSQRVVTVRGASQGLFSQR